MINSERSIVMDIDGTLCPIKRKDQSYEDLVPIPEVVETLISYKMQGFYIILHTARNMRTHNGNMGLIMANTAKQLLAWLDKHQVPYDEIFFGKPWPGRGGFYVDDKTIRPDEFLTKSYEEILELISKDD
ncbi:HAD family hydrolase [Deinococcus phoenicis]|uniref:capsular biosynthesis protein n=1 Tax=Deinococcus phoenicis TaxID=1476583 RepID=UPI00190F5659|nr:capsular biosynthesis protein [Deinococcus phoenicis]